MDNEIAYRRIMLVIAVVGLAVSTDRKSVV